MNRNYGTAGLVVALFWIIVAVNILWFGWQAVNPTVEENGSTITEHVGDDESTTDSDFYYSFLTEDYQKEAYHTLYNGLKNRESNIVLNQCSAEEAKKIWDAVLYDRPEIFWALSYRYLEYKDGNPFCEILPDYVYTTEEIKERQDKIEQVVAEYKTGIGKQATDYEKILYTYEFIVGLTEYSWDGANNQNIDSVLIGNLSVCAGYTKTTKYLLEQVGISSIFVYGMAQSPEGGQESHAWNIVSCEGEKYLVDTTWGDPISEDGTTNPETVEKDKLYNINYQYLCFDDKQLSVKHEPNTDFEYPACENLTWNYYVVNKRYIDQEDKEQIKALIEEDVINQKKVSDFKFASKELYDSMHDYIITEMGSYGVELINSTYNKDFRQYANRDDKDYWMISLIWTYE